MAIDSAAAVTRELLVASGFGVGGRKETVVAVGDGVIAKTSIRIVPGNSLIRVRPNKATFISGLVASPIQNLPNFSRSLKRFGVGRAGLGTSSVEFLAASKGRGDVRARVQLVATLRTLTLNKVGTKSLSPSEAFECYANDSAAVTLTLPKARRANVGLEYFFAVDPSTADGTLTINVENRDAIQIRESQTLDEGLVVDAISKRVESITGTQTVANANRTSVVLACRAPGLWVAENVAADDDDDPTAPLWALGTPIDD